MEITLTKEQYKALAELVYLGNYLANTFNDDEDIIEEYNELEAHILSFAPKAGLAELVEKDDESGECYVTEEFAEAMGEHIENYDTEVFWDQLIGNLANRDFIAQYGLEAIEKMELVERMEKEEPILEKYENEFEKNGLDNLAVKF